MSRLEIKLAQLKQTSVSRIKQRIQSPTDPMSSPIDSQISTSIYLQLSNVEACSKEYIQIGIFLRLPCMTSRSPGCHVLSLKHISRILQATQIPLKRARRPTRSLTLPFQGEPLFPFACSPGKKWCKSWQLAAIVGDQMSIPNSVEHHVHLTLSSPQISSRPEDRGVHTIFIS